MKLGYVDSSCLVSIVFDERGARALARHLEQYDRLFSSNLLEAELRSALRRENVEDRGETVLSWITWIYPTRPLSQELTRISSAGYVRSADMWHLAHALFLAPDGKDLEFLTLDERQGEVSRTLGFVGLEGP